MTNHATITPKYIKRSAKLQDKVITYADSSDAVKLVLRVNSLPATMSPDEQKQATLSEFEFAVVEMRKHLTQ